MAASPAALGLGGKINFLSLSPNCVGERVGVRGYWNDAPRCSAGRFTWKEEDPFFWEKGPLAAEILGAGSCSLCLVPCGGFYAEGDLSLFDLRDYLAAVQHRALDDFFGQGSFQIALDDPL